MTRAHYEAIIIGLGAMGSAALYHLASRGARVIGVDSLDPPHSLGSTHGRSRIIREAYFEHPSYVPLVRRAYENWSALENESGETLFRRTGGLMVGAPESALVRGTLDSVSTHGIDVETLWRWQADMERTVHVSLSSTEGERDEVGGSPVAYLRATTESIDDKLQQEETVTALREAILQLKEQQRTVLSLYYFEELNAREIADVLGISESRVSQIRSKALSALRGIMRPMRVA